MHAHHVFTWWFLALTAAGAWGVVGLLQKVSSSLLQPSVLLFWVIVGLSIGSVGLSLSLRTPVPTLTTWPLVLGLICGLVNAVGSWCLFAALETGAPASVAIPLTALYPLITMLLAVLTLHESISWRQSLGALLSIGGGALLSIERRVRNVL